MKSILIITSLLLLSIPSILAQDKIKIDLKDEAKADVYIDGKKYDREIFELLDQSKIKSVSVLKGEKAIKEYNAPHGVIIITTKNSLDQIVSIDNNELKVTDRYAAPVIIVDGKRYDKFSLSEVNPDNIESIQVVKGEKAIKEYDAPNGVVIIKTKN